MKEFKRFQQNHILHINANWQNITLHAMFFHCLHLLIECDKLANYQVSQITFNCVLKIHYYESLALLDFSSMYDNGLYQH